jgi:predicted nucleic acid-binding protein
MKPLILLDTNILIDYLAVRQPFYPDARKLMILGAVGEVGLWLSASQVSDAVYVLSDGGQKSAAHEAQARLRQCRQFIHICALAESDIDAALGLGWSDFEDACVSVCAKKLNADYIITRDGDFPDAAVPRLDAAGYLRMLESEQGITYEEIAAL